MKIETGCFSIVAQRKYSRVNNIKTNRRCNRMLETVKNNYIISKYSILTMKEFEYDCVVKLDYWELCKW